MPIVLGELLYSNEPPLASLIEFAKFRANAMLRRSQKYVRRALKRSGHIWPSRPRRAAKTWGLSRAAVVTRTIEERPADAARKCMPVASDLDAPNPWKKESSSLVKTVLEQAGRRTEGDPAVALAKKTLEQDATNCVADDARDVGDCVEEENEYPGGVRLPCTSVLNLHDPQNDERWPVFRILDKHGRVMQDAIVPDLAKETAQRMYRVIIRLQAMDEIFFGAQRQGRISFYMTSTGEEAIHVGSASALDAKDIVFAQYREAGVLMWRGFTLQNFADQCYGNEDDLGKGRQMPVHYGSRELNFQTVSSPLATQIPQAVGAAYALKMQQSPNVAVCYFGEGAASEGDFHAALNFSATLETPVIFICRNNGYAISTPVEDQYRGDGIVSRASGYGVAALRVDGNDALAVHQAIAEARKFALEHSRAVLIEAMTYRVGHHSTSDDSTRYRSLAEIRSWKDNDRPDFRFRAWLEDKGWNAKVSNIVNRTLLMFACHLGWWDDEKEAHVRQEERNEVLRALQAAEKKDKPSLSTIFEDVYSKLPDHLLRQKKELEEHVERHKHFYKTSVH